MSSVPKNIGFDNGDSRNATGTFKNIRLRQEAAGSLADLNVAFKAHFGQDIPVLEGMRSVETQQHYWRLYQNGTGNVAAVPGTSNHGWGVAVDFGSPIDNASSDMHAWLRSNAAGYGWFWAGNDFGEPWHWEYDGRNVDAPRAARYNSSTPTQEEGLLMALTKDEQKQVHSALVSKGGWYWPEAIVGVVRTEVAKKVDRVLAGDIKWPGAPYNAFDALAGILRKEISAKLDTVLKRMDAQDAKLDEILTRLDK